MVSIVISDVMSSIILMVCVLMGIYYASRSVEVLNCELTVKQRLASFAIYSISSAIMLIIGLVTLVISTELFGTGFGV